MGDTPLETPLLQEEKDRESNEDESRQLTKEESKEELLQREVEELKKKLSEANEKLEEAEKEKPQQVKEIVATGGNFFRQNLNLAFSMGFWITIFCIPVCSKTVQDYLFGEEENGGLDIPGLLLSTRTDMIAQWPTVFTLMFFMVSVNTGTTVSNCWSALVGIVCSTVNIQILNRIFPVGAKCLMMSNSTIATGLRPYCEEYADPNYAAFGWVVWVDFFLFLFIELASNSTESTMKFGICWHIGYMMNFMKPEGFTFSFAQVATALTALLLAIMVTLVPNVFQVLGSCQKPTFSHVATLKLRDFPEELALKASEVWANSIDFMCKSPDLDRHTRTSMRFAIDSKIDAIDPIVKQMGEFYAASWWEKVFFILCCRPRVWAETRKHVKRFIDGFGDNIGGVDDMLYMAKKVILSDDYDNYFGLDESEIDAIKHERKLVQNQMRKLSDRVARHLIEIARPPESRDEELEEAYDEETATEEISKLEVALREAYKRVPDVEEGDSRPRVRLRNQLGCQVFGLLCYSNQVKTEFGTRTHEDEENRCEWIQGLKMYFANTYGAWKPDKDGNIRYFTFLEQWYNDIGRKMFTGRNFVSISTTFLLGNFFKGNVYDGFNANMATTLAILISHFPGTAFETNIIRLLGLTLGKVLPIIMMALVSLAGSRSANATAFHLAMICMYESFFAYIAYTSKEWGGMACLVAGFGCAALVGTRTTNWSDEIFKRQYMEIGQVTGAIMIQMVVDVVDTTFRGRWPRDMFVKNMVKLGMSVDKKSIQEWNSETMQERMSQPGTQTTANHGTIVKAFESFMGAKNEVSLEGMLECIEKAKKLIDEQDMLLGECKERSVVIRGPRTPFMLDTAKEAMGWIRRLMHEIELLYMVYQKGPAATGTPTPHFIHSLQLDPEFQKGVLMALRITFMDLQTLLEYDKDGFINRKYKGNPKMEEKDMNWRIDEDENTSNKKFSNNKELQRDLCVCVAQRALYDALNHVSEIQHICYSTGKFDYEQFDSVQHV